MFVYLRSLAAPLMFLVALFLQSTGSVSYQQGRDALDRSDWQGAVEAFEQVPEDDAVADAALYWQAYAYNKLRETDRALESVALLERRFPNSEWRDDAQALSAELRGGASGESENDELKLMALNALMHPPIFREADQRARMLHRRGGHAIVVVSAAVLVESGAAKHFDRIVVVSCRPAIQLRRLVRRDGLDTQRARARLAAAGDNKS